MDESDTSSMSAPSDNRNLANVSGHCFIRSTILGGAVKVRRPCPVEIAAARKRATASLFSDTRPGVISHKISGTEGPVRGLTIWTKPKPFTAVRSCGLRIEQNSARVESSASLALRSGSVRKSMPICPPMSSSRNRRGISSAAERFKIIASPPPSISIIVIARVRSIVSIPPSMANSPATDISASESKSTSPIASASMCTGFVSATISRNSFATCTVEQTSSSAFPAPHPAAILTAP